jgi:hypothetical protein
MGKGKMVRIEKTTLEEYYNFPIEDILSDARLVLESGDERSREPVCIPIFIYSRSLKKQQAEKRLKEKYSSTEGRRKPGGNIEQKNRVTHLNVHRGGLYKPPAVVYDDPILTDKGVAWIREERAKMEDRKNA